MRQAPTVAHEQGFRGWIDAENAWQLRGACRWADPELFFHSDGERGDARQARDAAAKRVCARCPVILRCRTHALTAPETSGVWGGLSESERAALRARQQPAATP